MTRHATPNFFLRRRRALRRPDGRPLSQQDIAVRLSCVCATIGNWERDEVLPPLSQVGAIARAYELSVAEVEKQILAQNARMGGRAVAVSAD